jgi:hypothetical protein
MLRDQNYRINTTSLKHGKISPHQQRVQAVIITSFKAILLHHSKSIFFVTSMTPFGLQPLEPQPAGSTCPLASRTLPMTGHGVMRLSGDGGQ